MCIGSRLMGYLDARNNRINFTRRLKDKQYREGCKRYETLHPPQWSKACGGWTENTLNRDNL